IAALTGDTARAHRLAAESLDAARAVDEIRHEIRSLGVLGLLALAQGDPASAVEVLRPAVELADAAGFHEPGFFRVDGDLIEALSAVGDLTAARGRAAILTDRAQLPWAQAAAARARALVLAGDGDVPAAIRCAEEATERFVHL